MSFDFLYIHNLPETIVGNRRKIHAAVLRESPTVREGNFKKITQGDLEFLYEQYDRGIFEGWLTKAVGEQSHAPVQLRLASTMTSNGGKLTRFRDRRKIGKEAVKFELKVATGLLFNSFADVERSIVVGGIECHDRLEALQRVVEHEIVHLMEFVTWGKSSCAKARFKSLVRNIFGHTESNHRLITARERAAARHAIDLGAMVEFEFEGRRLVGRVNRINRRATVLVEAKDGRRYSDGGVYQKYYIPVGMLRRVVR